MLVKLDLEAVSEQFIFFTRLSDSRTSLQVTRLVDFVRNSFDDDFVAKSHEWVSTCRTIDFVTEVAEGTCTDLDIASDEVRREARLKLHQLALKNDIIDVLLKEVLAQYRQFFFALRQLL